MEVIMLAQTYMMMALPGMHGMIYHLLFHPRCLIHLYFLLSCHLQVYIQDVRVGDQVACMNTAINFALPTTLTWCNVTSWSHADPADGFLHVAIKWTSLYSGKKGSIKMSIKHFAYVVTDTGTENLLDGWPGNVVEAAQSTKKSNITTSGTVSLYKSLEGMKGVVTQAGSVKKGDLLAVSHTLPDGTEAFEIVKATGGKAMKVPGYYIFGIESPYPIVDNLVVPNWLDSDGGQAGIRLMFERWFPDRHDLLSWRHMMNAPLWTRADSPLPVGTSGRDAAWVVTDAVTQNSSTQRVWPGGNTIIRATLGALVRSNTTYNLDTYSFNSIFKDLFGAWRNGTAAGITSANVIDAFKKSLVPVAA